MLQEDRIIDRLFRIPGIHSLRQLGIRVRTIYERRDYSTGTVTVRIHILCLKQKSIHVAGIHHKPVFVFRKHLRAGCKACGAYADEFDGHSNER